MIAGKEYRMAKNIQKLKPDTVVKNYWRDNCHFADFFNAVLFGGEEAIRADELEDVDTEGSTVFENKKYAESIQASRDNIKVCKRSAAFGVEFVLLGMEGQGHIHYGMPLRNMGYDYTAYKKQYDSNAVKYHAQNRKQLGDVDEDEYLSRMKRTDRFMPVITVTVYYGDKPWDGATSLHGLLNIPQGLEKYVNDYKMLLIEARENRLELHNMENKDLFNLFGIILDKDKSLKETREEAVRYCDEHDVSRTVIMTVAGATGNHIDYEAIGQEKGGRVMCALFESIAKEGRAEGRAEGREEGRAEGELRGEAKGIVETGIEFGASEHDIIKRLQNKLNLSLQTAQEYFQLFGKQTV